MASEPKLHVKETYQNIHMEIPIEPGVYHWKKVPPSAIGPLLEHGKAVWVGKPPREFASPVKAEDKADVEPLPEVPDFFEMNAGELRDYAAAHGIAIPDGTKNEDLIRVIEASLVPKAVEDEGEDEDE